MGVGSGHVNRWRCGASAVSLTALASSAVWVAACGGQEEPPPLPPLLTQLTLSLTPATEASTATWTGQPTRRSGAGYGDSTTTRTTTTVTAPETTTTLTTTALTTTTTPVTTGTAATSVTGPPPGETPETAPSEVP